MRTILLKLSGPLQSWGTDSSFETRATDYYPSKSGIIGMISAALGYKRDEDEKISRLNELDYGVRVDYQGKIIKDYHIARKYNTKGAFDRTYVTNRYYIEDGVFIVAIGHQDHELIEKIEEGLKSPYYQTFMGRRSCPPVGRYLLGTVDMGVVEALKTTPWEGLETMISKKEDTIKVSIYADGDLLDSKETIMRKDRVKSFSQRGRDFGYRAEKRQDILLPNPYYREPTVEHDIFTAIGGEDVSI